MSARLVVLPTGVGVKSLVVGLPLIPIGEITGVPLVPRNITRMVFGFDHLGALHAVIAVRGRGFACSMSGSLASMRAERGGEHAAPAAQHQGKDNTDIYDLSRHGFYFDRLINTPLSRLSMRNRTDTPTGYA
jgi:hypothetical protein